MSQSFRPMSVHTNTETAFHKIQERVVRQTDTDVSWIQERTSTGMGTDSIMAT